MKKDILIVGVGGQGTLLASRVLGALASELGTECKLSEVHGMSQRGGSVVTHVRMGDSVRSPMVTEGEADFILAFEKLEALRWSYYLADHGKILVNNQEIMPMPVITGQVPYPDRIFETLTEKGKSFDVIEGLKLAEEAGNTKAVNVVMIGALLKRMGVEKAVAEKAVTACVPQKLLEVNLKALSLGYEN